MKWADALLMTKAEQWSYEDEYRCIDPHGSDLREFQKEQLTGVVFGCQMPVEDTTLAVPQSHGAQERVHDREVCPCEPGSGEEGVPGVRARAGAMTTASDTFGRDYAALEAGFRLQSEADEAVYVPNAVPTGPTPYVFVCMEPSIGAWAGKGPESAPSRARDEVKRGFLNFMYSYDDFILHHAARTYLCAPDEAYHVTDISKGAMTVVDANRDRQSRYERWLPLLRQELDLLSVGETRVIAVGKQVAAFLEGYNIVPALTLLHYSSQAARARNLFVEKCPEEYECFAATVSHADVMDTFAQVTDRANLASRFRQEAEKRLHRAGLSESRKKLLFVYRQSLLSLS